MAGAAWLLSGLLLSAWIQAPEKIQAPEPAQAVAPASQAEPGLRPGEIYQQAMKPLDLVRSSLDNWSDTELGALSAGMRMARVSCNAVNIEQLVIDKAGAAMKQVDAGGVSLTSDDDLFDLIRLCALGQDWNQSLAAAKKYLAVGAATHRSQAYALSINAMVRINDLDGAVEAARAMLHDVPYDAEVAYATQFLKAYLTQSVDPRALTFATEEHGALVEALKSGSTLKPLHGGAVMGVGTLYTSGMQLAFLQRYAGDERGATRTIVELDAAAATSQSLTAPDVQLMGAVRKEYGLLGHVLPEIEAQGITSGAAPRKFRSDEGFVTVVVMFPDYCPQCVKTITDLKEFAAEHVAAKVHGYGLVVREVMEAAQPESWKALKGANLLAVKPGVAQMLGAVDYPLFVVTDEHGLVYFVGTAPANAFVPNGYMEQTIGRIVGEVALERNAVVGKGKQVVRKPN